MEIKEDIDLSCLFKPDISFQEAADIFQSAVNSQGSIYKLSCFLNSENSSQISFRASAHLGFLFSNSLEKEFAEYLENTVSCGILLANDNSLQSMQHIPEEWPDCDLSEYSKNYSMCLHLRQTYQIPLVDNIDQVLFLEEFKIDDGVVKVEITFQGEKILASAIIKATKDKPVAKEISMYMQKNYPRFYGVLSNIIIQNQLYRLTFFDQHAETLKQNIDTFIKNQSSESMNSMKNEREAQALNFYRQLVAELNYYRDNNLFHKNICPSNILIYNNSETPGEYKAFLFNGECLQFKLIDRETVNISVNRLMKQNRINDYIAPELANTNDYCKIYRVNYDEFSYNISDAWSLAACILNFITNEKIDKWNLLNFAESLKKIINKTSNERLKYILINSLEHDLHLRLKFNDALERFD